LSDLTVKDGGPAFPAEMPKPEHADRFTNVRYSGMSLRDYFAAQALTMSYKRGVAVVPFGMKDQLPAEIAMFAYLVADAMLAERAK